MSEDTNSGAPAERLAPGGEAGGAEADPTWRRLGIVAGVIAAVVVLFIGIVWLVTRSGRPDVLVAKLREAEGEDREALVMRLNLARGDTVTPLIEAFRDREAGTEFRLVCLDLLFKKNARASEEKIVAVLREALSDADTAVRRSAVYGFAVFMDRDDQLAVVDLVSDPDPEVRRQVYMLLSAQGRGRRRRGGRGGGIWRLLSEDERKAAKEKLIAEARSQAQKEADPELKILARSVLGRRIEELCHEATEAAQRTELAEAEALLDEAIALDPGNHQAMIRHVRHFLSVGDTDKAFALAEEYGALLRVPLLSEAPVVDGDPSEDVWNEALKSDRFWRANGRWVAQPSDGRSEFYLGHVGGKVYMAILGYEEDIEKLVVKYKARDSDVWRDDCVELFFDPTNSEKNVYQFVINAAGGLYDGYRRRGDTNVESESAAQVFKDRGYWCCEFAVAASVLEGGKITPDSVWGMNIMRTRIGAAAEQCAWWPTFGWSLNFHLHPIAIFEGLSETTEAERPTEGEKPGEGEKPAEGGNASERRRRGRGRRTSPTPRRR